MKSNSPIAASSTEIYLGIMSGTSLDGIDIVAASFPDQAPPQLLSNNFHPLPENIREPLLTLINNPQGHLDTIGQLDQYVAEVLSLAVNNALAKSGLTPQQITAIGSHGITLRHKPELQHGFSWQIGNPAVIAERTGITTIGDFRSRDVAAGGQGAPLVPRFHQEAFQSNTIDRAVVNIGGMANITMLPKQTSAEILGFDTGPGNVMLDYWIKQHRGEKYDRDGAWAQQGVLDPSLLEALLDEPFFQQAPPKSTGRELFNPEWLTKKLQSTAQQSAVNIQATLLELTATTITDCIKQYQALRPTEVILCGGGARNTYLKQRIQALLPESAIMISDDLGVDSDSLEALAFAWLAKQTMHKKTGNMASATGAQGERILGAVHFS